MDSSSESRWSEPVVSVQSLSEGGLHVIPDRYVKPPPDRPSLTSPPPPHNFSIPIIDLDLHGLEEADAHHNHAIIEAISDACKEWGFFQVVNHGVSPDLMDRAREAWREFFHQPLDEKNVYSNTPDNVEGYGSRLGNDKDATLDWGDYFYLHLLPESVKNPSKWPASPSSCRVITEEYGREVVSLCQKVLMKLLSTSLGLEKDTLNKCFGGEDNVVSMRVNLYPKCPQPDLTLGLSAHSDPGGITVLLPDDHVDGLQVKKGDEWITVQNYPGALIVNIGDMMQIVSNSTYKSVEHRVIVNPSMERLSIAIFYNPRGDLPIGPAQDLVSSDCPPLYRRITYYEYRMSVIKKGTHGKSHVESLKAL